MAPTLYAFQEIIARRAKTSERVWSRSYVGVGGLGAAKLALSEITRVLIESESISGKSQIFLRSAATGRQSLSVT